MTQLLKIWTVLKHVPQIIAIITAIINVVGSEQFKNMLEVLREALKKEAPPDALPTTEPERKKLVQRLWQRLACNTFGYTEQEYAAFVAQQQRTGLDSAQA